MMAMCLSIVTLLLSVGSDQCYVVFLYGGVFGECCQVPDDSRGGIFSSIIGIQFNVIELPDFLLSSFQTFHMPFNCLCLDDTQRGTYYISDVK